MKKDFLTLKDYSKEEIEYLLDLSGKIKKDKNSYSKVLEGKNIAMLFDKHSTRTRLSFEVGINQLGGNSIYLDYKNLQISRGETYQDTAKIFSRYLDGVVIRTYSQEIVDIFAKYGTIPVINGLTDIYHPCQILADMFTLKELGLLNKDLKFIYIGDSNNVTNSLIIGFSKLGIDITIGCPEKYSPPEEIIEYARNQKEGSKLNLVHDPVKAVSDADVVYTDVWLSMGDEINKQKLTDLKSYQVNYKLLKYAKEEVKVMHCLPAHRGQEITSEVLDGKNSIVLQQAENRLHAQKALLVYLYAN
ncbi:MAG: ornithine carbamoyltransferase [Candidatus Hydromicrobium sp.]|nr:ornithine carbamoyltransferase [Actinomycetota bacterium]MDP3012232.1 ornithine carbamoyltransferase [Candidatus Hydromicrobium sp.]